MSDFDEALRRWDKGEELEDIMADYSQHMSKEESDELLNRLLMERQYTTSTLMSKTTKRFIMISIIVIFIGLLFFLGKPILSMKQYKSYDQTEISEPKQVAEMKREALSYSVNNNTYTLTPVVKQKVTAMVLVKKLYDDNAEFSPMDLGLGWDKMTDEYIRLFSFAPANRMLPSNCIEFSCNYKIKDYAKNHLKNYHIIPATKAIEEKLNAIKERDVLYFEGYLVNVKNSQGIEWGLGKPTSQSWFNLLYSETDCNTFYVTKIVQQ